MVASFKLTETKPDGSFRNLPLKYSTGLKIKPRFWTGKPDYRAKQTSQFEYESFNVRMDDIENACKIAYRELLNEGANPTLDILKERLNKKLEKPSNKSLPENENFDQFIDRYNLEAKSGIRISAKGRPFKMYTLKNFKTFSVQFKLFEEEKKKLYNFDDINIDFYDHQLAVD